MFTYMGVMSAATAVLWCREVNGESFTTVDTAVACGTARHMWARIYGGLLICGFGFGFPLFIVLKMKMYHLDLHGNRIWKPGRFSTMVRISYVYDERHRWWQSFLLVRRFVLVGCSLIGRSYADSIPFGEHARMDWRALPFFVLVMYVLIQASQQPYSLPQDNVSTTSS